MGHPDVPRQPAGVLPDLAAFAHGIAMAFMSGAIDNAIEARRQRDMARRWVRRLVILNVMTAGLAGAGWLLALGGGL